VYPDRATAGRRLADELAALRGSGAIVLGLARGGIPVAAEVALALGLPLDVLIVRKLGHPHDPELGVGALGEDGVVIRDEAALALLRVGATALVAVEDRERAEVSRRVARYRGGRPSLDLRGRTAIVVDDGLATGVSARAAVAVARGRGAAAVVLAVPVGSSAAVDRIRPEVEQLVCPADLTGLGAVGGAYEDFHQVDDDEVLHHLGRVRTAQARPSGLQAPAD